MTISRRHFIGTAALGSAALAAGAQATVSEAQSAAARELPPPKHAVILSSANGRATMDAAYRMLAEGADTLDAAIHVCRAQEDDPNDDSVGYGGLPNEEGVVELDSCLMHGPTRRAGAVAGVRNIRHVSSVARLVMERTDHVLLVGEGAERFAVGHGFARENLLTERSRRVWMLWKESHSRRDSWGPGLDAPDWTVPDDPAARPPQARQRRPRKEMMEEMMGEMEALAARVGIPPEERAYAIQRVLVPPTGTIHVSALNAKGEISGVTTTSGLAWKIPGRSGDSPVIGAGCYTDQDVGSAGSTGRGEEVIKICGAHTIVENMRRGMTPREAGLDALRRISRNYDHDKNRLRFLNVLFYALRRDGEYAGVALWNPPGRPRQFAVTDAAGTRLEPCVSLFEGTPTGWPPIPRAPREAR